MSWFTLALVLHILGVLALFGAISLELTGLLLLRHAKNATHIGEVGMVLRRLGPVFGIASGLILLSGVYMTVLRIRHHEPIAWVVVSVAWFVALGVAGSISGRKMEEAMRKAMAVAHGALTPELERLAHTSPAQVNAAFGPWSVAGLVVLMVAKPSAWLSIVVLAVSLAIGFVAYQRLFRPADMSSSRPAVGQATKV